MLEIIAAIDDGAVCSTELLSCCRTLVERLEPFFGKETTIINRLQIKVRLSKLNDEDDITLAKLIASSNNSSTKACASILRGDQNQTKAIIGETHPISKNRSAAGLYGTLCTKFIISL